MKREPKVTIITQGITPEPTPIPDYQLDGLAQSVLRAVRKYFESPAVQADFERWQQANAMKATGAADV